MRPVKVPRRRDFTVARKLRRAGCRAYSVRIAMETRRAEHVSASLGAGLLDQESDFQNVFGCDVGGPFCHLKVTKARVLELVRRVRAGATSNGVGPPQLTWIGYIEEANRDGGAWRPSVSIATGIHILDNHIARHGEVGGLATYNAGHPSSVQGRNYAAQVRRYKDRYHAAQMRR